MIVKTRAVFIDRDGVVNSLIYRGRGYFVCGKRCEWTAPHSYEEFKIFPFVAQALLILKEMGLLRILVTNQPDVSYGLLSKENHERIMSDVRILGFDDIFVCPHMRDEKCECKKPKSGMLLDATSKWNIDLASSYLVGDTENDMSAAHSASCRFILVRTEYNHQIQTEFETANLLDAGQLIKKLEGGTHNVIC